jgi:endonuclease/exonuclease/phosphatase family metal-dependent hydrolase
VFVRSPGSSQLVLAFTIVAACGASSPTGPSEAAAVANPEFRVMTFNVQHGLNGAGKYDLNAAVQTIAKVNPDLVGVQELTRNHPSYNCDDQPAKIADALSAATGRRWSAMYQQEWFTPDRSCEQSGRGDGPETEGVGFFAPDPLGAPTFTSLWNGRVGLMAMLRRGRDVPVVVTHLAQSQSGASDRMRQLEALLPWVAGQPGGARILIGDFNLWPDSEEYRKITSAQLRDAWADASARGVARGRVDGITHNTVRIDYVFYKSDALDLLWAETIDTRPLIGAEASDHNPVQAAFRAK